MEKRKRKMVRVDSTEAVRHVKRFIANMKRGRKFDGPVANPANVALGCKGPANLLPETSGVDPSGIRSPQKPRLLGSAQTTLLQRRAQPGIAVEAHEGRAHDAPIVKTSTRSVTTDTGSASMSARHEGVKSRVIQRLR